MRCQRGEVPGYLGDGHRRAQTRHAVDDSDVPKQTEGTSLQLTVAAQLIPLAQKAGAPAPAISGVLYPTVGLAEHLRTTVVSQVISDQQRIWG